MAKKKNSLVANINARKKAGTSRSKSDSTVSDESWHNMKLGWPNSAKNKGAKKKGAKSKKTKGTTAAAKKKTAKKTPKKKADKKGTSEQA